MGGSPREVLWGGGGGGGGYISWGVAEHVAPFPSNPVPVNPGEGASTCLAGWDEVYVGFGPFIGRQGTNYDSLSICLPEKKREYEYDTGKIKYEACPIFSILVGDPRNPYSVNGNLERCFTCRVCVK